MKLYSFLRLIAVLLWTSSALTAHAAHPLITEDTGTQGQGKFQLDLTSDHATLRESGTNQRETLTTTTFSYGVVENLDIIVSLPHLRLGQSAANGTTGEHGLTDAGLDMKWRFFEKDNLSLAFKPGITFPTGDNTRGLGAGKHTWSAYLTASYKAAPWTWLLHLGHVHNNNSSSERVDIWHASAAVVRQLGETLKLILDTGIDTNTDRRTDTSPVFLVAGLIFSPHKNFDIDLGYKLESADAARARTLLAGLTLRW